MDVLLNYSAAAIMLGIAGVWIFLIKSMTDSFRLSPYLDRFKDTSTGTPRVSVILPARNEEDLLGECLDSLAAQDYDNYEIVAVDDSSTDDTSGVIARHARASSRILPVSAGQKPDGWMGKSWACMEGYKKATGDLLLFTDADTKHSKSMMSLAVAHLLSLDLDALTVVPRMRTFDFWTRITMPVISISTRTRGSALIVNNPGKKLGYFFGSFFIIRRSTYEGVGMHEGVKSEIFEDAALGGKVKSGYKMRMVRGEHLIDAVWARDRRTLWDALRRTMTTAYLQAGPRVVATLLALSLMFAPLPTALAAAFLHSPDPSWTVLFAAASMASVLMYAAVVMETRWGHGIRAVYAVLAPIGGLVILLSIIVSMIRAGGGSAVAWRGRQYSMSEAPKSVSMEGGVTVRDAGSSGSS